MHQFKPDAGTLFIISPRGCVYLCTRKEPALSLFADAHAVIADSYGNALIRFFLSPDMYRYFSSPVCVLDRICEQVPDHNVNQVPVEPSL